MNGHACGRSTDGNGRQRLLARRDRGVEASAEMIEQQAQLASRPRHDKLRRPLSVGRKRSAATPFGSRTFMNTPSSCRRQPLAMRVSYTPFQAFGVDTRTIDKPGWRPGSKSTRSL